MKKKALFGLIAVIVAMVFLFSACAGSGVELQIPMQKADLIGLWEGTHYLLNRDDDGYDSEMAIKEDGDGITIMFSNTGNAGFTIPIDGEIQGNQLILSRDLEGFTFSGTYTFTDNQKNCLTGEILRIHPDNRVYHWEGELDKYTSEYSGWAQDVEYFKGTLPEKHINLFFKVTEQEFNQACDNLIEIANTVSDAQVFLGLLEILALVDDAHTNIYGFGIYQSEYYPFDIKKIGREHYVFSASEGYEEYLGAKLTSINEHTIEQIRNKTEKIIPAENDVMIAYRTPDYLNSPEALEYCGVVGDGLVEFILNNNGVDETIETDRLTRNEYTTNRSYLNWTRSIAEKNLDKNFWYEYLEEDSILYFQYNRCRDNTEEGLPKFAEVQAEILEILETQNPDKLVVDVRYNSGGSSRYGTNFVNALKASDYNNDIYVITGNQTFSSGVWITVDLKQEMNALIIGEPSSNRPNHYGNVSSFELPNSGLKVSYSNNYWDIYEEVDVLEPDIPVYRDFEDYVNGVDTVLEHIKGL